MPFCRKNESFHTDAGCAIITYYTKGGRAHAEHDGLWPLPGSAGWPGNDPGGKDRKPPFLDLSFRLPRNVGFLEEMLRRELTSGFQRGHMDVFVAYRNTRSDARQVRVDAALAAAYMEAARRCRKLPGRANRSAQHS